MTAGTTAATGHFSKFKKLSVVVPALTVAVAFTSSVAVGIGGYMNARSGLESAAERELALASSVRRNVLSMRFDNLSGDLRTTATSAVSTLAFTDLNGSLANVDRDKAQIDAYFRAEGSEAMDRAQLTGEGNKTMYSWRHQDVHGGFLSSWKNGGYGDIYAINPDGLVIYSVTKSVDFLDNVKTGGLQNTGLADVFARALTASKGEQVSSTFEAYAPAGGAPSMFVAQPVYISDFSGETFGGVIAVRVTSDYVNSVTKARADLGETGQSYLVSSDGKYLSDLPLADAPTALSDAPMPDIFRTAFAGEEAEGVVVGADGVARMTVATPMPYNGETWAVVTEKSVDEAMASVTEMKNSMIIMTLVTLGIAALVSLLFSRSITRPLAWLVNALEAIAAGDTNTEIRAAKRGDEIGDIGRAVVKIRENAQIEQEHRAQEEALAARSAAEQRQEMLGALAADFEASVGQVVEHVSRSAASLREATEEMRQMMEESGQTSTRAAKTSAEAMNEVQSIASASDQLSSSIQEISALIERSAAVAKTATVRAESTNETVRSLAEAANRIGEVVTLISDIADQTNLLALNATIEAARAGEAGRGFAVVASEVKELASQTGKATGEIQQQIDAIRAATEEAVGAIGDIQQTIGEISQSVTDVSAAVTEQSYATRGIAENTQRAAVGTSNVSDDISNVSQISEQTREAANNFARSMEDLNEQTGALDRQVRTFLQQVRSA